MDVLLMQQGHPLWERTIEYARHCSWRAGAALARRMSDRGFNDWERVIAAVEDGRIAGFCTLTEKDELPDAYGYRPFIGFVFVDEQFRGRRISGLMIACALQYAGSLGFHKAYIMSGEKGLYEKYGFEKIGDFETVYGTTDQLFRVSI